MRLVEHTLSLVRAWNPRVWALENPATGRLPRLCPGLAVLGDSFEEGNWRVTLDGSPVPCFRVNHAFLGVNIPEPGQHTEEALLEAGYTTILVSGQAANSAALADKVAKMEINGPRIIPSGAVNLRQTPAEARAQVQALAAAGVKNTAEIGLTPEPAPPQAEIETLKAIVDEAKKVGVQVNVHAVSSPAMVAAAAIAGEVVDIRSWSSASASAQ